MFHYCTLFNQNINTWDVSKVTDMAYMFGNCYAFNQPLNNWNVINVKDMSCMFQTIHDNSSLEILNSSFNILLIVCFNFIL
jgi:surface protein